MSKTVTLKPVEASLTHNTDWIGHMNPYCVFTVDNSANKTNDIHKTDVCKKGGKNPTWDEEIVIPINSFAPITLEVMDKNLAGSSHIGHTIINLEELQNLGNVSRWYPLTHKNKSAGDILVDILVGIHSTLSNNTITNDVLNTAHIEKSSDDSGTLLVHPVETLVIENSAGTKSARADFCPAHASSFARK